ncbi:ABC transporter permease [Actinoallomurus bryophytorum]|uniref:Transport permease protein n=1 Tax=Actinoallomurus bryophytorum TaxID=1490222 RepID=A0A543CNJ1_9ACTN|nr:ABC transporter permease [Actinoallomurus bryophytorum]TQL98674.1 ABC-2 type transport system permease protein [Actinoallomurus bryophytorum]
MTALAMPSTLRVGLSRGALELKGFVREKEAMVFTFAMPVLLMVVFGTIFKGRVDGTNVDFRQYFAAGIIASGIASTTFISLGVGIAQERDDGTLKRLYGTPMPPAAYFIGKTISALVLSVTETVILFVLGGVMFGLRPPSTLERWSTLIWVFAAGVTVCTLLGIAVSSVPRSGRGAAAVLNLPYLVLQFISGVYFTFSGLPSGIQQVGAVFPLKWICQGLRSALLPDTLLPAEPAHSWEHGRIALVLAAWGIAGFVLCLTTFRWKRRGDG